MADEDESAENFESPQGAEELVRNLLEQVKTIGEKVKKKKEHLEEVSEKYHNEARHLQGILSKLYELRGSFSEGERIQAEFEEFCESLTLRSQDLTVKLEKLDAILDDVRVEEEKIPKFSEQALNIDTASLSTGEGRKEFLDLKQDVDDWFDTVRLKFKEGKKRKLSLYTKGNVEDLSHSLHAWRKASEVAREYGRKLTILKSNEQDLTEEMHRMRGEIEGLKNHNKTLDDEISLLRGKLLEAEQTILENQTLHEDITEDLREKLKELREELSCEKRTTFGKEMEADELRGKLYELQSVDDLSQKKIEMLQDRTKLLEEDIESLRERLLAGEKDKEDAESLLFELQRELEVLNDANDEEDVGDNKTNDYSRVNKLVQTLKKKLEENQGYIENLESEIKGEKNRNHENADEIEKLLQRIEVEEKGKEEQGKLIDTIRNLLDENEKLAADLESQNKALNEDISEERSRVMELRGRVGELQEAISDEKKANFDMEMEVSRLKHKVEDEETKSELGLRRIELLQEEIATLLNTIKEKVEIIEELRSQLSDYEEIKGKLKAERQRNESNEQSIVELQNRMVQNEDALQKKETEIRNIREELKDTKEKLEGVEKELEWIKENNNLLSGILQEKDRTLLEKEERLKQALVNLDSERTVQNEYSLKCNMLEKKIYLTESENSEITKVAELAENELQKEKEKCVHKENEISKLKEEIEEERRKNLESQRVIQELDEQLSEADALNQYNQGIKSSSIENIMEAEKQNEQLLNIIEELKENVNEKELGIEELVSSYAVEEQRLRDELSQLKGQLGLSKMDNQTKSEIIRYLKDEIERMRNVMRIKASILGTDEEGVQQKERVAKHVEQLEQGLGLNRDRSEGREDFDFDEELEERKAEVQELLEILEGEKEKNIMYEEMIQQLEEMVKLQDEITDADESDGVGTERANETRKEFYAKKEEYKRQKQENLRSELSKLEEIVEDLRGRLRAEQRHVKDRDNLIKTLNQASNRDLARNEELSVQLQAMKDKAKQQLEHSEEMAKKVEDGQKLIRDLEMQVEKERLRALTIEELLSSEKGQSKEKKEATKDLKRRVEEYQKTVNDIKGKVDKINRHLHCMSPGSHESHRMGSSDVSVKRINERLASHSSFIRELKASMSAVEETSKSIRAELRTQTDRTKKQEKNIDDLLGKSAEYDNLVEDMKRELGEIRKRYQELSGELGPDEDGDSASGRPESPTKLVRLMPEHELSKQLSHFEELLETIFSEEAQRIEELQSKLDEVFKKNIEFSVVMREIRDNLEEGKAKRGPWEVERDELKAAVAKSEVKIDHLVISLQQEEMAKQRLHDQIQQLEEEVKEKEKRITTVQVEIRETEGTIQRLEKELAEEKERNFDLQERVMKEMEDSLQESKTKLDEIRVQAEQEMRKTADKSAAEKSEKEVRIKELEKDMLKQGDVLDELRSFLEKEQNQVFELNERLEIERNHSAMKENMIENLKEKLRRESERSEELRKLIEEAEDRTLRLSEALTQEQVRGVEREEAMKHLCDRINEEQHKLSESKDALEEELQLTKQLREKLSFEQLLKSEFERELDKVKSKLSEERKTKENLQELLCRDKNLVYESENKLREQLDDAKEKEKLIHELKSDLETERKCYKILSERLQCEQNRIVELEEKLKETESVISSDREMIDCLRDDSLKGDEKLFEILEKLERTEKLNREKEEEIGSLVTDLAAERKRTEGLMENLESERFTKAKMEERIKELEETNGKDELLFQELRNKVDVEVVKNREIAEKHDQEKMTNQMFRDKVRELESQVAQDSEIFEELNRTIEIEREQSRKLDELLHQERNETVRRDNVLTELEGQLFNERITKEELQGQLESEKRNNSDLHDLLRTSREDEFSRREVERKLAEEMKYEVEEKIAIQAKKAEELESMLEAEKLNVMERDASRQELQRSVEQRDFWLSQLADELTKDMEESQSSTDEEKELRTQDLKSGAGPSVWAQESVLNPVESSPYDNLFGKILAGRDTKRNVKLKSKERKRRLKEKEMLLEEANRKFDDERKLNEEKVAELRATKDRMKLFESENHTNKRDSEKLRDELENEQIRSQSFEVLLAEQQKSNRDQNELVKSLEDRVNEGYKRLHVATQQYEEQLRENRTRQEEIIKLRDLCEVQEDKIEELDKELRTLKTLHQEKDYFTRETFDQVKDLRKQLDGELSNIEDQRKVQEMRGSDTTDAIPCHGEGYKALSSLREEVENVKKVINYKLNELSDLRQQVAGRGEITSDHLSQKKIRERAEKAESQLKKLQSSYHLLLTDAEMKKFLVEDAQTEAKNLRRELNEKNICIKELKDKVKSPPPEKTMIVKDDNEVQKLKLSLSQQDKLIQDMKKEYKSKLIKKEAELRELQLSLQIMKSIYQGLKAEKEREDAVKNAEKARKSKEDISAAIEMVSDLQQQIDCLQEEITGHQQMAQTLKENDKTAKLPNENDKSYLKRRSSLRGVLSLQIDEKEKKLKRLRMLLKSIENRYGKEMLEIKENETSFKGELTSDSEGESKEIIPQARETSLEQSLPLPDLVGTTQKASLTVHNEISPGSASVEDDEQSCFETDAVLHRNLDDTRSISPFSKKRLFVLFLFVTLIGAVVFAATLKVSNTLMAGVLTTVLILLFISRFKRTVLNISDGSLKNQLFAMDQQKKELLEKIEEMKLRQEGDTALIADLKRQLEEEIADKEAKRVESEEIMATKEEMSNKLRKLEAEDFESRMKMEIEKTKLSEAEKMKRGYEEYKMLKEEIDHMKRLREKEMDDRKAKISELEKLETTSEEATEDGIKTLNLPISVLPICIAVSVLLCQLGGYHFLAPYMIFFVLITVAANAWYSKRRVSQVLRNERQNFAEQNEEMDDMTELLDRQFEVVKSQKSAIDMLMKEIEKEKQERKEKRTTLAKLIWQLQEMEGMQNIISKQAPKAKEVTELEAAVRSKAEEKALARAKFYNTMIKTLKEINADDEEDDEMTDDLCSAAQELADYAEDQLEEQKKRELEKEKPQRPKKRERFQWKSMTLFAVNCATLAISLALQSYLITALVAIQAAFYALQWKEGSVDQLKAKLRREATRNRSLQLEIEKMKTLLETEKTYKVSDEYALEIKERKKARKSTKIS